jgi:streptogramin lyase
MFPTLFRFLRPAAARTPTQLRCRLVLEALEDRMTPSSGNLFVTSFDTNSVIRYDGATGAFLDTPVPKGAGGLSQPYAVLIGPDDHQLYVSSGTFGGPGRDKAVLQYDAATGVFLDKFVDGAHLTSPRGIIFGPDGNLYVTDGDGPGRVVRYDGHTGAFLNEFVPLAGNGGLTHPAGLVFGPSGRADGSLDLYVSGEIDSESIFRYDGHTGAFLGKFVADGSVQRPLGLTFGPDGNLYVADFKAAVVHRFRGPGSATPGAPAPSPGNTGAAFVAAGSGGLEDPLGVVFGPDGNGDGRQDLYVSNARLNGTAKGKAQTSTVKRYDGVTGAFIDTFVTANSGGLDDPNLLAFTETDPVTLAYTGDNLMVASGPPISITQSLPVGRVQPLFAAALARWQAAGADTSVLDNVQIQTGNLGGHTLGMASGHTIWLDADAAGWGWFVDPTPGEDSEFNTPGDQGEQNRMDLLTVLTHELGHSLGLGHDDAGVMQESLPAGTRRLPTAPEGVAATALPAAGGSRPDARRAAPRHPAPGGALDRLFAGAGWAGLPPWDTDLLTDLALLLAAGA